MSCWTHIVSTIDVDTHIADENIKEKVEKILENAPKITGSESDADIFVNKLNGHNIFTSADCQRCKYKDTIIDGDDGFSCESEEDYTCPSGEYQTRVVITIMGDLRDRTKETTLREYKEFVKFIKQNWSIRNKTVKITY